MYRQQIQRSLQIPENKDDVNVLDDTPELLFGPKVNGKSTYGPVPPFYVSLHIHDKVLHNAMFDSGASDNLIPKAVMEKLNLDFTRPYKDLFSFDSSQVKCLGLIKDLCVSLVQYPNKTILMDVVVVDIPPKYGMLLSRSWGEKLQWSLQLDLSYATISVFGQPKRLYRETLMKYVVSSESKPENFPIYSIHSDMDSFILFNDDTNSPTDDEPLDIEQQAHINEEFEIDLWKIYIVGYTFIPLCMKSNLGPPVRLAMFVRSLWLQHIHFSKEVYWLVRSLYL